MDNECLEKLTIKTMQVLELLQGLNVAECLLVLGAAKDQINKFAKESLNNANKNTPK